MASLERFSFTIERSLAQKLERLIKENQYQNRSEFIRDLVRDRLVAGEWKAGGQALGTVSLVYEHHKRNLGEKLVQIQHHHAAKVLATTHVHLDGDTCAEMIMVTGKSDDIRHLYNHLRKEKGVLHASLSLGTTGKKLK